MTTDDFARDDVAYVLGALPLNERLAFETHLLNCDPCTTRVTQARALTGLLTHASPTAFTNHPEHTDQADHADHAGVDLIDDGSNKGIGNGIELQTASLAVPETLLPALLGTLRRNRRRRRVVTGGILALAASIVAFVALTAAQPGPNNDPFRPPPQAVSMAAARGAPIAVRLQIETKDSWAQVNLWASYPTTGFDAGEYTAVAHTKTGQTVTLGTWPGVPGNTTIIRTPTGLHTNQISTIEVLSPTGQPLAWTTL